MKKLLTMALAFAMAASLTLGIAACGITTETGGNEEQGHTQHSFIWVFNNDATCTEDGTETERCSCGETRDTRVKTGSKLGHDMKTIPAKEATCSENGYRAHTACSRCGYTTDKIEYTPALHVEYYFSGIGYTVRDLSSECTHTEIKIPETYMGWPVVAIQDGAFFGNQTIEKIELPDSLEGVSAGIFKDTALYENASNWDKDGALYIGKHLISVKPETEGVFTVKDGTKVIASRAFEGCDKITGVRLPEGITAIGLETFQGCAKLADITLPDSVEMIYDNLVGTAFYENASNWESGALYCGKSLLSVRGSVSGAFAIKEGTKAIACMAFMGCSEITSVSIPEGVKRLPVYLFYECGGLTNFNIPANVTTIDSYAICSCNRLESVTIAEGSHLKAIGGTAFVMCDELKSIDLPEGVEVIASSAFEFTGIESIVVPTSVKYVGYDIVSPGSKIYYKGSNKQCEDITVLVMEDDENHMPPEVWYCFSEEQPTTAQWAERAYWWHYDGTGKIVEWTQA